MKKTFKLFGTKALLIVGLLIGFGGFAQAQSNQESIDLYQSLFGMEKKDMLAQFIQVPAEDPFWEIYDAYEKERKSLGQKRLELINEYAQNYSTLSVEKTDELIKKMQAQKKSTDALIDKYYEKIKKANGSMVAAQFYQFENYILSAIRVKLMDNVPFIGEE